MKKSAFSQEKAKEKKVPSGLGKINDESSGDYWRDFNGLLIEK